MSALFLLDLWDNKKDGRPIGITDHSKFETKLVAIVAATNEICSIYKKEKRKKGHMKRDQYICH